MRYILGIEVEINKILYLAHMYVRCDFLPTSSPLAPKHSITRAILISLSILQTAPRCSKNCTFHPSDVKYSRLPRKHQNWGGVVPKPAQCVAPKKKRLLPLQHKCFPFLHGFARIHFGHFGSC